MWGFDSSVPSQSLLNLRPAVGRHHDGRFHSFRQPPAYRQAPFLAFDLVCRRHTMLGTMESLAVAISFVLLLLAFISAVIARRDVQLMPRSGVPEPQMRARHRLVLWRTSRCSAAQTSRGPGLLWSALARFRRKADSPSERCRRDGHRMLDDTRQVIGIPVVVGLMRSLQHRRSALLAGHDEPRSHP